MTTESLEAKTCIGNSSFIPRYIVYKMVSTAFAEIMSLLPIFCAHRIIMSAYFNGLTLALNLASAKNSPVVL
jgi:hypothetical protein